MLNAALKEAATLQEMAGPVQEYLHQYVVPLLGEGICEVCKANKVLSGVKKRL